MTSDNTEGFVPAGTSTIGRSPLLDRPMIVGEGLTDDAKRKLFFRNASARIQKNEVGQAIRLISESIMVDVMAENTGISRSRLYDIFFRQTTITADEMRRLKEVLFEKEEDQDDGAV